MSSWEPVYLEHAMRDSILSDRKATFSYAYDFYSEMTWCRS